MYISTGGIYFEMAVIKTDDITILSQIKVNSTLKSYLLP